MTFYGSGEHDGDSLFQQRRTPDDEVRGEDDASMFDELPQLPRSRYRWVWILLTIMVLLFVLPALPRIVTEWYWFRELGHTEIYWTLGWGRWAMVLIGAAVFFAVAFGSVLFALRRSGDDAWYDLSHRLRERSVFMLDSTLRKIAYWGSGVLIALFGLSFGSGAADYFPQILLFLHPQKVGAVDPIFSRDIGFYLFRLPVLEFLNAWLGGLLILTLIFTVSVYLVTRAIRAARGMPMFSPGVRAHLSILLALIFINKAYGYYLGRFGLLATQNGLFTGPGYTDVHARIPGLTIMVVAAVLAAVVMAAGIWSRRLHLSLGALVGLIVVSMLVLGLYPAMVQRFRVNPTELKYESPYLARHINMTRKAYGLDKVRTVDFMPRDTVSEADLAAAPNTVKNIRLWDHRPLLQTYRQRQVLRTYYEMSNVDIDRYKIDGDTRQVMLAAREMNVDQLPGEQSWLNRHLLYTHGYGLVMSTVNSFDPATGEPILLVRDIPPVSQSPALKITRPGIYFGEQPGDYIVVRGSQQEFDYPQGEKNQYTTYTGKAGIPLRSPLLRGLMALQFGSLDLLISGYIDKDSRIVYRRNIIERARTLAPFFVYDRDPYIVIGTDGHLYWMLDAYTRSARYPYAAHTGLDIAGDQTVDVNYVRNPVKVVIDAYDGTMRYYVTDENEPYVRAWRHIFPRLFQPLSAMPAGLDQHVRVPEGLFNAVSEVYQRYHMIEPTTFYQKEDQWDIPQEAITDAMGRTDTAPLEAYYLIMSLPGETAPEYLIIRPYTPTGKQNKNMIAWLSARNDPGHLGEMIVYNFPKQRLVNGPQQIQAIIQQDDVISKDFTLWDQAGSRVWRGNLLVIPIDGTLLYIQPIYLQAETSQIPELKRVIVTNQRKAFMRPTLEEALAALTGGAPPDIQNTTPGPQPAPVAASAEQQALARSALEHYDRAQQARRDGDWATYGKEMEQVGKDLEALNK